MTVEELIEKLKQYPAQATVVLGSGEIDHVFDESYDVFDKRAVRIYGDPRKFVTTSFGSTVVVIA